MAATTIARRSRALREFHHARGLAEPDRVTAGESGRFSSFMRVTAKRRHLELTRAASGAGRRVHKKMGSTDRPATLRRTRVTVAQPVAYAGQRSAKKCRPGAVFTAAAPGQGWGLLSAKARGGCGGSTGCPAGARHLVADLLQSSCSVYSAAASTPRNAQPCEACHKQQQARRLGDTGRAAVHEYRAAVCGRLNLCGFVEESDDVRPQRLTRAYALQWRDVRIRGAL